MFITFKLKAEEYIALMLMGLEDTELMNSWSDDRVENIKQNLLEYGLITTPHNNVSLTESGEELVKYLLNMGITISPIIKTTKS